MLHKVFRFYTFLHKLLTTFSILTKINLNASIPYNIGTFINSLYLLLLPTTSLLTSSTILRLKKSEMIWWRRNHNIYPLSWRRKLTPLTQVCSSAFTHCPVFFPPFIPDRVDYSISAPISRNAWTANCMGIHLNCSNVIQNPVMETTVSRPVSEK